MQPSKPKSVSSSTVFWIVVCCVASFVVLAIGHVPSEVATQWLVLKEWQPWIAYAVALSLAILTVVRLRLYAKRFQTIQDHAEQLRVEINQLRAVLDDHTLLSIADRSGKIIHVNDGFCAISGYNRDELIGQDHRIVNSGTHPREFWIDMWKTIASGNPWRSEVCNRAKDGSLYWVDSTIVPWADEPGKPPKRYVSLRVDITERKRVEEELQRMQKLDSIGELAAGIAHEINTPMQFVGTNAEYMKECCASLFGVVDRFIDLLDEDKTPQAWATRQQEMKVLCDQNRITEIREQMPAAIEESLEGVKRVVEILAAMKQFSHPGSKQKLDANLNSLIDSTLAISRNRWKYVAEVNLDLDPNLPEVPVLASEINQVLLNLVVNAADAITEKNGGREDQLGVIRIRTFAQDDWIAVEMQDDGCGMPEEVRKRVFDPFFTTKRVGKGTGQGLAITHNVIVNQHGGAIAVDSQPGQGTKFTVKLPLAEQSQDGAETNVLLAGATTGTAIAPDIVAAV